MKFSLFLTAVFFLFNSAAMAALGGDEMGNGGLVTKCMQKSGSVYEVYDLFEGRSFYHLKLKFAEGADHLTILNNLINRFDRLNPSRAKLYRQFLSEFPATSNFVSDSEFMPTPDMGSGPRPDGCSIEQVFIQFKSPNIAGIRYFVNESVWNKLDEQSKASLLMHEFIYREGLQKENNFSSSMGVRYLNAIIHSENFETMTLKQYLVDVLGYASFADADAGNYKILLHTDATQGSAKPLPIEFWENGQIKKASLGKEFSLLVAQRKVQDFSCTIIPGAEASHTVEFYESGLVKTAKLKCTERVQFPLQLQDATGFMAGENFYYNSDGSLDRVEAYAKGPSLRNAFRLTSPSYDLARSLTGRSGDLMVDFNKEGAPGFLCYPIDEFFYQSWYMRYDTISSGERFYLNMFPEKKEQNVRGFFFGKSGPVNAVFVHCEKSQRY